MTAMLPQWAWVWAWAEWAAWAWELQGLPRCPPPRQLARLPGWRRHSAAAVEPVHTQRPARHAAQPTPKLQRPQRRPQPPRLLQRALLLAQRSVCPCQLAARQRSSQRSSQRRCSHRPPAQQVHLLRPSRARLRLQPALLPVQLRREQQAKRRAWLQRDCPPPVHPLRCHHHHCHRPLQQLARRLDQRRRLAPLPPPQAQVQPHRWRRQHRRRRSALVLDCRRCRWACPGLTSQPCWPAWPAPCQPVSLHPAAVAVAIAPPGVEEERLMQASSSPLVQLWSCVGGVALQHPLLLPPLLFPLPRRCPQQQLQQRRCPCRRSHSSAAWLGPQMDRARARQADPSAAAAPLPFAAPAPAAASRATQQPQLHLQQRPAQRLRPRSPGRCCPARRSSGRRRRSRAAGSASRTGAARWSRTLTTPSPMTRTAPPSGSTT